MGLYRRQTKLFEPLFIEEDEDYFEDCLEEIEAALTLPGESMPYSIKCREALQAEFNGLMQQMLSQLDAFDAAHPTTAPLELFSETVNKMDKNGFTKTIEFGETCIPEKEQTVLEVEDNAVGIPVEARSEFSATMEIQKLREVFESCIEEVGQLERRRDELVQELLELEEPMAQELQSVRETLGEEQGRLYKVRLERQSLQEETQKTKRRLFIAARDCAQRQVQLELQQKEVEQLNQAQVVLSELKVHWNFLLKIFFILNLRKICILIRRIYNCCLELNSKRTPGTVWGKICFCFPGQVYS